MHFEHKLLLHAVIRSPKSVTRLQRPAIRRIARCMAVPRCAQRGQHRPQLSKMHAPIAQLQKRQTSSLKMRIKQSFAPSSHHQMADELQAASSLLRSTMAISSPMPRYKTGQFFSPLRNCKRHIPLSVCCYQWSQHTMALAVSGMATPPLSPSQALLE